jgi:hypothetical protein
LGGGWGAKKQGTESVASGKKERTSQASSSLVQHCFREKEHLAWELVKEELLGKHRRSRQGCEKEKWIPEI